MAVPKKGEILWFNGKRMPDASAITFSKEPIWSKNAGRGSTGKFVGDIVAYKFTIKITWPILAQAQTAMIDAELTRDAFLEVKFIDPTSETGAYVTKTVYAGAPTYPVYSYVETLPRYKGVAVDLVEQ